jgi:hypothetical protein
VAQKTSLNKLTRSRFLAKVSDLTGYHPKAIRHILEGVAQVLNEMLLGDEVERVLTPLGTFYAAYISKRRVTDVSDPRKWVYLPAHRLVRLRPIELLRQVIGSADPPPQGDPPPDE